MGFSTIVLVLLGLSHSTGMASTTCPPPPAATALTLNPKPRDRQLGSALVPASNCFASADTRV